ncbi:hypothetical protein G7Z17_g4253 [Cylindrodendrum hubeiense]|uniref:Zn(2)-C6 fungal-type domain-containing protein n=1 Tax=Cylindrodendrum hubeiense TaxID=595255 RepID=A0A9P5LA35_9HYPO|nr:hypothetical protein G7Z17_g4253 [Cylindrodendrum hubeiense]
MSADDENNVEFLRARIPDDAVRQLAQQVHCNRTNCTDPADVTIESTRFMFNSGCGDYIINIDGTRLVVRVILLDEVTVVSQEAMHSVMNVMSMIRDRNTIPVPDVYCFDTTDQNPLKAPYTVISYHPGRQLPCVWYKNRKENTQLRLRMLDSLANTMVRLASMQFDAIGCPISDSKVGSLYRWEPVGRSPTDVRIIKSDPFTSMKQYTDTIYQPTNNGPVESEVNFLFDIMRRALATIDEDNNDYCLGFFDFDWGQAFNPHDDPHEDTDEDEMNDYEAIRSLQLRPNDHKHPKLKTISDLAATHRRQTPSLIASGQKCFFYRSLGSTYLQPSTTHLKATICMPSQPRYDNTPRAQPPADSGPMSTQAWQLIDRPVTKSTMAQAGTDSRARTRGKTLRTYGKRAATTDARGEAPLKKRRTLDGEQQPMNEASKVDETDASPLSNSTPAADGQDNTATKPQADVRKGSIMNFFKPVPQPSSVASSPQPEEVESKSPPPSPLPSPPPQLSRAEARRKPRILKFRGRSLPRIDTESLDHGSEPESGTDTGKHNRQVEPRQPGRFIAPGDKPTPTATALICRSYAGFRQNTQAMYGWVAVSSTGLRGQGPGPAIRRVKCDEAKPSCQRCLTSKRQCDGYLPGDSTVTRRQLADAVRQLGIIGPVSKGLTQYPGPRSTSSSPDNLSLFDVFRKLTAPSTASFLPSNFWTGELLQLAHAEPAVWHATLALGALHQKHELATHGLRHDHRVETFSRLAAQNYAQAVSHAQALKDPHKLLSLSLALVSITNMMGRWSESQVHIMAGHRLVDQAKGHPSTKVAAEMLMRLDLQAMTFSESSAPYPYEDAPDLTEVTKCMRAAPYIENYDQAGTALFGLVRRFLLADETCGLGTAEEVNERLLMRELLKDLVDWEFKMAAFERNRWTGEPAALSVRLYHTLLRLLIAGRRFGQEMRWDNYLGYFERSIFFVESLLVATATPQPRSPLSLEPGLIIPLFLTASKCRHPVLRSRAVRLLRNLKRQEGMWFSDGTAAVVTKMMSIEGQTVDTNDLPPIAPPEEIPWESWSMGTMHPQASTSWEGFERVPETQRVRETLVMVMIEQRRVDITFIMCSGDEIGTYGDARFETILY